MPEGNASCTLPDGTVLDLSAASPEEAQACLSKPGTTLRLGESDEQASPPPAPRKKVMNPKPEVATEAVAAPVPPPAAPEAVTILTAHEEQPAEPASPATASSEIAQLMQSSGGGALGLVAALVAVVGGTAGFKLWTKISEQKHEQSMKKLDIEQANAGLSGAQPPPCQAAHHTLVADIKALQTEAAALKMRFEKVEKATSGMNPMVDVDDLEERVVAIEKTLRKKARTAEGTH